jgi:RNase P subunit RPR2
MNKSKIYKKILQRIYYERECTLCGTILKKDSDAYRIYTNSEKSIAAVCLACGENLTVNAPDPSE